VQCEAGGADGPVGHAVWRIATDAADMSLVSPQSKPPSLPPLLGSSEFDAGVALGAATAFDVHSVVRPLGIETSWQSQF
jgi:hypothetical protein